jgi:ABC-type glycerol-3-phosphate transport system substrate-binding protein
MSAHARRLPALAALLLSTIVLGGCGSSDETAVVTVTERAAAEPPPPETVTVVETAPEPAQEVEPAAAEDPAQGEGVEVPDVVGLDHQLAQDTMQASGLYNLAEEDATGQGRLLLWDRNWTVVSQDPPAGTVVTEDRTIILRSKKDDE